MHLAILLNKFAQCPEAMPVLAPAVEDDKRTVSISASDDFCLELSLRHTRVKKKKYQNVKGEGRQKR